MRTILSVLALVVLLAACDSSEPSDTPFSLTVTAETSAGDPVSGLQTYVRYLPASTVARSGDPNPPATTLELPLPNPASGASRLQFAIPQAAPVQIYLLSADSVLVETLYDEQTPAGVYALTFDTDPIPGGAYRVQLATPGETVERWMLINDDPTLAGTFNFARGLGVTGSDGAVETTDRAAALNLFDIPPVVAVDDQGNPLGTITILSRVEIVVTDGSREVTKTVRLADRENDETVVW